LQLPHDLGACYLGHLIVGLVIGWFEVRSGLDFQLDQAELVAATPKLLPAIAQQNRSVWAAAKSNVRHVVHVLTLLEMGGQVDERGGVCKPCPSPADGRIDASEHADEAEAQKRQQLTIQQIDLQAVASPMTLLDEARVGVFERSGHRSARLVVHGKRLEGKAQQKVDLQPRERRQCRCRQRCT
jgi:hypothetical protein